MRPLVWSSRLAAAGAALIFAWLIPIELGSSRTASRSAATANDDTETVVDTRTGRLFDLAALLHVGVGVSTSLLAPAATIRRRRVAYGAGVVLLVASGTLSAVARRHLGSFHRDSLTVHDDHVLVETGPYRYVRHPLYLATLGVFGGLGAVLGNWISVGLTVVPAAAVNHRIAVEEKMLLQHFGGDYSEYRNRTGRMLPAARSRSRGSAV